MGELVGIQYLRGIAAMMVLFFHVPVQLGRMGYHGSWLPGLSAGVDIFYVISGMIMWVTTIGRSEDGPLTFWRRRILRIVPLYWLVTAFVTLIMLLLPAAVQTSRFNLGHVIASFLFVGHAHPTTHVIEPVVIPGWTLNHEMFFYLIFGLFLLTRPRIRLAGVIAALVLLVLAGRLMAFPAGSIGAFYTSDMLLEFGLGVGIGALASQGRGLTRLPVWAGWGLLMLGTLGLILLPGQSVLPRIVANGMGAVMLAVGLLTIEAHRGLFRSALLHRLGNASYSIYLSHMITLSATSQFWRGSALPTGGGAIWGYIAFAVIVSTAAGWLLYLLVERPLTRHFHRQDGSRAQFAATS